jgi:hypothetical protein
LYVAGSSAEFSASPRRPNLNPGFTAESHTNFPLPIGNVFTGAGAINPTASLITATATTSRQLQFGLKINF